MNKIREFFRTLAGSFRYTIEHFMTGRYGMDKLNMTILITSLIVSLLASIIRSTLVCMLMAALSYGLMIWAIYRCFSRNTYRRYEEYCRYQMYLCCIKDRQHRYYRCPKCHQMTRVPRGKGKISISCPRCGEKFLRKS